MVLTQFGRKVGHSVTARVPTGAEPQVCGREFIARESHGVFPPTARGAHPNGIRRLSAGALATRRRACCQETSSVWPPRPLECALTFYLFTPLQRVSGKHSSVPSVLDPPSLPLRASCDAWSSPPRGGVREDVPRGPLNPPVDPPQRVRAPVLHSNSHLFDGWSSRVRDVTAPPLLT